MKPQHSDTRRKERMYANGVGGRVSSVVDIARALCEKLKEIYAKESCKSVKNDATGVVDAGSSHYRPSLRRYNLSCGYALASQFSVPVSP